MQDPLVSEPVIASGASNSHLFAEREVTGSAADLTAEDSLVLEAAASSAEDDRLQAANDASVAAYQEGIRLASSASRLSESAFSPDDWGLIASRWQRAALALEQVSESDENYTAAQEKIVDYRAQAEAADARIERMQTPIHVPLPPSARRTSSAPIGRNNTLPLPGASHRPVNAAASRAEEAALNGSAANNEAARRVTVPIVRRLHGTPVVRVTFNGAKTYEMILDTGASRTLITRQMANALDVVATEQMTAATASSSEVTFDVGRLQSISLGEITLRNTRVSIGDSVSIGLLGNDFLRGYDVIIRARTNVVELVDTN